jgi:hypothetical protein
MLKQLIKQSYSSQPNVAQDQAGKNNFVIRNLSKLSLGLTTLAFAFGVLTSSNVKNMADRAGSYLSEKVPYLDEMSSTRFIQQYDEMDWSEPSERSVADISAAMGKSPSLRQHVLNAYLGESFFSPKRYGTHHLFSAYFDPDIIELAKSLIQKKSSPLDKVNGINLIVSSGLEVSPFQEQFRDILFSESDSHVLVTVVLALVRPVIPAPDLRQRVVNKLHELTFSPSKILRGVAVKKLAEWDGDGQFLREDILRLMSDQDTEVRADAIQASAIGRSAYHISIKNPLVQLLADVNEDPLVRGAAWDALYNYDLNEDEYVIYNSFH